MKFTYTFVHKDINLSPENVVAPNESLDPDVGLCYLERKLSIQVSECIYVFMIHLSLVFSIISDSITEEIRTQASKWRKEVHNNF